MTYRRMLYLFAIIKQNHFEVIMCVCFSHNTKLVHFEMISFYNSKGIYIYIYNILQYIGHCSYTTSCVASFLRFV